MPATVLLTGYWWARDQAGNHGVAGAAQDLLVVTGVAGLVCLVVVPLYGVPIYLFLRRLQAASVWAIGAAGVLPGVLWWVIVDSPERVFVQAAMVVGLATSVAFWATARRLERNPGGEIWSRSRVLRPAVTAMIVGGLSILTVLGTLAIEVPLDENDQRVEVALGYPLPFLQQQAARLHKWPDTWRLRAPQEYPVRIHWARLVFNVLAVAALIYAAYWLGRRATGQSSGSLTD